MLASAESHTFWTIALGIGAVVLLVVIGLMVLLLSFLKDIEAGAAALLASGRHLAGNTAAIEELAATGPVLEELVEEAKVHDAYLSEQTR